MPYYKFDKNDIFVNTLKLYPEVKFVIYSGSSYYNSTPNISGAFTGSIRCAAPGDISLFEMNIDRNENGQTLWAARPKTGPWGGAQIGGDKIPDTGLIYPWLIKDGSRLNFRTSTKESFSSAQYGDIVLGASYPYTASISKEFYSPTQARYIMAEIAANSVEGLNPDIISTGSVSHLLALRNTINYYRYLSPHFEYSSSVGTPHNRDFSSSSVGLISIPSIFYGSSVKKGSVNLEFYYTGSLIARAQDTKRNGELIQTYGASTPTGSVVGLVLYNEGFIILTSSVALGPAPEMMDLYTSSAPGDVSSPTWVYFGSSISGSIIAPKSTFILEMSGTTKTQVLTMFATAPKGELNHSNNPSYLQPTASNMTYISTGSAGYFESDTRLIANMVSSAYADPTGSFEKTTYISKIGIYDQNKNLMGIAKVSTPIKKTVGRDFTFKIKLDI